MIASELSQNVGTLVVGIGSSHGDDQAGWKVIGQLERLQLPGIELRRATVPHDLVDWLGEQHTLHIIDVWLCNECVNQCDDLTHRRFEWIEDANDQVSSLQFMDSRQRPPATAIQMRPIELRSAGSHQIDVFTVLELAACLNRLPKQVVLWAIPGQRFGPGSEITAGCENAIASCVEQLSQELGHA